MSKTTTETTAAVTRTKVRKQNEQARNAAKALENSILVSKMSLEPRTSEHTKVRYDRAGKPSVVTVTKNVRPSKLIRTAQRAQRRADAVRAASAVAAKIALAGLGVAATATTAAMNAMSNSLEEAPAE